MTKNSYHRLTIFNCLVALLIAFHDPCITCCPSSIWAVITDVFEAISLITSPESRPIASISFLESRAVTELYICRGTNTLLSSYIIIRNIDKIFGKRMMILLWISFTILSSFANWITLHNVLYITLNYFHIITFFTFIKNC